MGSERIPRDEQIRLIQECRNSGMSDSQWCLQHGIRPGTFYNWVNRIKKKGDIHIPSPGGTGEYFPEAKQDIVRINLVREDGGTITKPEEAARRIAEPDPGSYVSSPVPVMELELNGARLRISNEIDPVLLTQVLQLLRGAIC